MHLVQEREPMSYLFIVIIGAITGWIAGQYFKGSEHGVGIDLVAGAAGACVAVLLSRMMGPAAAAGFVMSAVVSVIGGIAALYGMRKVMVPKAVPVRTRKRF